MTLRPSIPRVLVADDQGDILEALRLLLTDAGFDADLVSTVGDVEDRVAEQTYDLLLMDLNYTRDTTSGREGLDLVDRIRARDAALPIVVMTGWGSIDTAVEAMRRGARGFVQKPWDDTTLVDVVRREVTDGRVVRSRDARAAREQEEARLIQRALLPAVMPDLDGCTLAAVWTPASGIGGDCYDVVRFSPTRAAIAIADVIGHGLPAALLMSNLQAAVRAFATPAAQPHDVCTSVNRLLCRNVAAGKFVSFCYAVVDLAAGTVVYANAGHNPPALVRADGRVDRFDRTGLVLGVTADWAYTSGTTTIDPGDRLVFFTDGITEATSSSDEEFGDERLVDTIRRHRAEPADALARTLSDVVSTWTGGTFQDDATLIVLARD
ncbi:MAG TPA: SpoIIE family protein phosphatase [Vicinamibacterales bacterium]|jgi:sigma-B regulation protein RsbU (phosphoserine phosphatase)|nr:SpoIIE family protein phosphatase [Vicinamibacterales bacterium]